MMGKQWRSGRKSKSVIDRRENRDVLIFGAQCEKLTKRRALIPSRLEFYDGASTAPAEEEPPMAMTMTGEATLPADRPKVWALLNDPEVLKTCIPGCESLERAGDNGFAAVVRTKIGPVSATFKGKVELSDIVPLVGYTITGEGEGGVAGFAKGGAKVSLGDAAGGTLLRYDVEAHVGGKMAQLGARLIDGVAKNMADKFFANFAAAAGGGLTPAAAVEPSARPTGAAAPSSAAPASAVKKSWFRRIWEWFMSLWR
jgi:carbon monoxide dehydrogenase subunit G